MLYKRLNINKIMFNGIEIDKALVNGSDLFGDKGLILDQVKLSVLALSLRKVRSLSTLCIKVRRSIDNQELDIGFINNDLDVVTLLNFCGVSNGYISKWYDQSGFENHALQPILNCQPIIVSNGDITDGVMFDGIDDYFKLNNSVSLNLQFSPVAIFFTLKPEILVESALIYRSWDKGSMQYGITIDSSGKMKTMFTNGYVSKAISTNVVTTETYINGGFIWKDQIVQMYIDGLPDGLANNYTGPMSSTTYNTCIGRVPVSSSGGNLYFKGSIATTTMYSGDKFTKSDVLLAEQEISK